MARGYKTGGRKKGTKNRATIVREALARAGIQQALESRISPLQVVLQVMRGGPEADAISERQFTAATAALPYTHPRLTATAISATITGGMTHEERLAWLAAGPPMIEGQAEES
jgi:hypothetical protein